MFSVNKTNGQGLVVRAYEGDAKVLLAFSLPAEKIEGLAGFTIACTPPGKKAYYLFNQLQLGNPAKHVQNKTEPPNSSINAPIQKFRWLHVPGLFHQDDKVVFGAYTYTITPRYFDESGRLLVLDKTLSSDVVVQVKPFKKGDLALGFTRGFVQSQGFVHHFGEKALFKPKDAKLLFNTNAKAGKNSDGDEFTFKDEYLWSGFTARQQIFDVLEKVQNNDKLHLDVFAYDLNEPDILKIFLDLAREGRIRIILDDATLHHDNTGKKAEDQFQVAFEAAAGGKDKMKRGRFSRFQHNKMFIVKEGTKALSVLLGSTNLSVTGMYVNSNHVAVFDNPSVADLFNRVFEEAWEDGVNGKAFAESALAAEAFIFNKGGLPDMIITCSPHKEGFAGRLLDSIVDRVNKEKSSAMFAVMQTDPKAHGPVAKALIDLHARTDLFSCGITDSVNDLTFYKPSSLTGLRVTGKPGATLLPEPFAKEALIGLGHQVHHKFIVCGFNQPNAVVWFGSSNLALGGEEENGDQLIEVQDQDIATVFAIEAMALVDHFHFRDTHSAGKGKEDSASLFLSSNDSWSKRYYDKNDLHFLDRRLFAEDGAGPLKKNGQMSLAKKELIR